ncbi:hypothetical protein [Streptococcus pneumoniae]|uniref:hypothetical protein n=1 Tax=Streptococcus pneumoniae TaxID=1313 RepID=UPI001265E324|nr:hypothetical protein [Streptococcus pneumoniae]
MRLWIDEVSLKDKTDEVSSKLVLRSDRADEVSSKHCFEVADRTDEVSLKDKTDEVSSKRR